MVAGRLLDPAKAYRLVGSDAAALKKKPTPKAAAPVVSLGALRASGRRDRSAEDLAARPGGAGPGAHQPCRR